VVTGWNSFLLLVTTGLNVPVVPEGPTPINVEFVAPAGCSSLDSFYRGVRARTDRVRLAGAGEQGVQIRVQVFRVGTTIRGELRIGDHQEESETRRVDGVSCNEVVEALSLTAALALDPSASLLSGRDARPHDEPSVIVPQSPENTHSVTPASSNASAPLQPLPMPYVGARSWLRGVDVSAQALVASYMTHGLMLGPQVGIRLLAPAGRGFQIVTGVQGFHVSNELAGSASSAVFGLTGAALTFCTISNPMSGRFEVGACAFARGAWLHASAVGLSNPKSVDRSWWALGGEAMGTLRMYGQWRFELSAGLAVPLLSRAFNTGVPAQEREVGSTPIVAVQAGLGLSYRF
jgi:hypothetical protein